MVTLPLMQLASYLELSGETAKEFAARLGVDRVTIQRYKAGRIPRPAIVAKISELTGGAVSPADWYETEAAE